MKKKVLLTAMSATLSLGILGACGAAGNNNMNNDDGVNYSPVRYDRQNNDDVFDNNRGRNNNNNNNGVDPVRFDTNDDRGGVLNNNNNRNNDRGNNGILNTDLMDNNRGPSGVEPGMNRGGSGTGTR